MPVSKSSRIAWAVATFAWGAASAAGSTFADETAEVAQFYKGRSINIVIGYGPGGAYDAYMRALAPHFTRYIPGNPQVVLQYMPGAGSLVAANYVVNVAPKDGTTLGVFSVTTALEPLFGNASAKFDPARLVWIGNMYADDAACATWKGTGITRLKDVIDAKTEIAFGATGPGSSGNQQALVLKHLVGAKLKVVQGYKGIKEVGLALERGEIQAACSMSVGAVKSAFSREYQAGDMKIFVQFGRNKSPYFADADHFYAEKLSDEQRAIADLILGQSDLSRPIAGPPGLPPAITSALRKAFMATLADKEFLEGAAKMNVEITPTSGEATEKRFAEFLRTPAAVVAKVKQMQGP